MPFEVTLANSFSQKQAIYRLRYQIYVEELEWDPPMADHANRLLYDELDDEANCYLLEADGEPAGTLRINYLPQIADNASLRSRYHLDPVLETFAADEIMLSGRFMLHPRLRHGRFIMALLGRAYQDARSAGIRLNFADCSPYMLPLYEHLGYRRYADPFEDPGFGYKLPLIMLMGDSEGFTRAGSPLAREAQAFTPDEAAVRWYLNRYAAYAAAASAAQFDDGMFLELLAESVGRDPVHHLSLLKGLKHDEAQRFLAEATVIHARPGDRILRQGEHGASLFAVLDGMAEVHLDQAPQRPINIIGSGDTFGEAGLIGNVPRTANVVATTPCKLLVLPADFFQRFLRKEPAIAAKVTLNLARSLALRLAYATPGQTGE